MQRTLGHAGHLLLLVAMANGMLLQGLLALYPATGGKGAVSVTPDDLARLDPGEFLNDTIIDYGIKCAADAEP